MIPKSKFFELYGNRLVEVFFDSAETGDFMLLHPEERFDAADYIAAGHVVASVYETFQDDEDMIEMDSDISEHPYKIGYLVLTKE